MRLINIGFGNMVSTDKVVAVVSPESAPIKRIVQEAKEKGNTVTVLVPQFIPKKHWQNILHNQMSLKLKYALRWHEEVVVASYSYHLSE